MSQGLNLCQGVSHRDCVARPRCDGADTQHLEPALVPSYQKRRLFGFIVHPAKKLPKTLCISAEQLSESEKREETRVRSVFSV